MDRNATLRMSVSGNIRIDFEPCLDLPPGFKGVDIGSTVPFLHFLYVQFFLRYGMFSSSNAGLELVLRVTVNRTYDMNCWM